jgi:hypothetical protein
MKKFSVILATVMALFIVPCLAQAAISIRINFPLPPPIPFLGPPPMVVLPDTDVYVAPDYDDDIYFSDGWWWRPWQGRWYRSLYYDSGWEFYDGVPGWYGGVYPRWRDNYRSHVWGGHRWDYHPLPYRDVHDNWKSWQSSGHWRNEQNRGTGGSYRPEAESRRGFRGFGQEPRGPQPPAVTRPSPDLSRNRNAFGGITRGNDVRTQSNRGFQSRQSMPSQRPAAPNKSNVGKGNVGKGDAGRHR